MGKVAWRRPWQPAPVFVPGESHGQRSLGGCRPWGSSQTQLSRYTRTGSGPGVTQTCRAAQQLHGAGCRCALAHLTTSCVPSDVPKNATDGQVAKHAGPGKTMTFIYLSLRKTGGANKRWTWPVEARHAHICCLNGLSHRGSRWRLEVTRPPSWSEGSSLLGNNFVSSGARGNYHLPSNFADLRMWVFSRSVVYDSATPWTVAHQAPLSMGVSRQEYWSGLPFPTPGDLPNPGMEPTSPASPALAGRILTTEPPGKPFQTYSEDQRRD